MNAALRTVESRTDGSRGDAELIQDAVSELIKGSRDKPAFDALATLNEHPSLAANHSVVISLAYEEYCRRLEAGEEIDLEAFAGRFPAVEAALLKFLDVADVLKDDPEFQKVLLQPQWPGRGTVWLEFELVDDLGSGGFSRVFLARQPSVGGRLVVVKATTEGTHEARAAGSLEHPNIVPVYWAHDDPERRVSALCMPFLGRATLSHVLDAVFRDGGAAPRGASPILEAIDACGGGGVLPAAVPGASPPRLVGAGSTYVEGVLEIGLQVAEALACAHAAGILHCDVKPSNILLTPGGRALLFDFNLSRFGEFGEAIKGGTLPYMAPEQLIRFRRKLPGGAQPIDARTDVLGLGATLYEALCGRPPFGLPAARGRNDAWIDELLEQRRQGARPLVEWNAALEPAVADLIERCLAFDPTERPQSAREVAHALQALLAPARRIGRRAVRARKPLTALAVLTAVLAAGAGIWLAGRAPYPLREYAAGHHALEHRDLSAAIAHFDNAIRRDDDFLEPRFERAYAELSRGNLEIAYSDLTYLAERVPDGRVSAGLAFVLASRQEQADSAIAWSRRAMEQGFVSAGLWNNLGFCHFCRGELEQAAACFDRALALDPDLQAAHRNRARLELRRAVREGRPPDASALQAAMRLGPMTTGLHLEAAATMALAAAKAADPSLKGDLEAQAIAFGQRAIDEGVQPEDLAGLVKPLPDQATGDRLRRPSGAQSASRTPPRHENLLVNPLGPADLSRPLTVSTRLAR